MLRQPNGNSDCIAFIPDRISEEATAINKIMTSLTIDGQNVFLIDSTKGLLLCTNKKGKQYFVYNTLTNHYVSVPIPFVCSRRHRKFAKLIWEEKQQQLKIIQFSWNWKRQPELHIFNQEKWKWKTTKVAFSSPNDSFLMMSTPFLEGKTIYWMRMNLFLLCAYNMEQKKLYFLPIPELAEIRSYPRLLRESHGNLYYIEKYFIPNFVITVCMLQNKESGTWDLAHRIHTQSICIAHIINDEELNIVEFTPLGLHSTDQNILFVKITPSKFGVLNMDKLELTLVLDLQAMVGALSGRLFYSKYFLNLIFGNWVCRFEKPLWMLSLPRGPQHLPRRSSLFQYLACYR